MAGSQEGLEISSMVTILEAFAAFALVAGILVAIADTRAYPLALGIVVIAGLGYFLAQPDIAVKFGHLVQRAGAISSGTTKPGGA